MANRAYCAPRRILYGPAPSNEDLEVHAKTPSLDAVRARIDAVDAALLRLVDERASLAREVAEAKRASGEGGKLGLRPAREALLLRGLLAAPDRSASPQLTVRLWREFISDSLTQQGPFHRAVWGGPDPARVVELARVGFGDAPPLVRYERPEPALAQAKTPWGVAVLALTHDSAWWGRLLAEPNLAVFASLPGLLSVGPQSALAVAEVEVEPTGGDETYWVTDAAEPAATITAALAGDGVAAHLMVETGGLKLFGLAGFYQRDDGRLARAPGRLSGVIGAAPTPLDL